MLNKFWELQKAINEATDRNDNEQIEILGNEQDECVKRMTPDEFEKLLNENLPSVYKDYIKKLRG